MALQMSYNLGGTDGLTIATAYVRIKDLHLTHNPAIAADLVAAGKGTGTKYVCKVSLEVKPAKTKTTLDTWGGSWDFAYNHTSNQNPIQQAYAYLKTLSEFSAVTDVND